MIIAGMSDQALALVERLWEVLSVDDIVAGLADETLNQRVRATLAELAEPEFEVRMVAPAEIGGTAFIGTGPDGFRSVWEEWSNAFGSFRVELKRRLASGDQIVDIVRLTATTGMGGAPIEQEGAALWTVRDGKLASADFYLSADDALRAAGIDPTAPRATD
jgi:ketosteroid isomerase-like protein